MGQLIPESIEYVSQLIKKSLEAAKRRINRAAVAKRSSKSATITGLIFSIIVILIRF